MKNEIYIYGVIDPVWGISAQGVAYALQQANGEDVTLRINSGGGSIWEGVAIYNLLKAYAGKVTAVVDGIAGSMASVIAEGASEVVMGEGSLFFIHCPLVTNGGGNAEQLRKLAEDLDKHEAGIVDIYAARTGKSADEIRALMQAETFMTAQEAVANGFADRVATSVDGTTSSNPQNMALFSTYKNALSVAEAFKAAGIEFTAESFAVFAAKAAKADESDTLIADAIAKASAEIEAAKAEAAAANAKLADALSAKAAAESKAAADIEAAKAGLEATASAKAAELVASLGHAPIAAHNGNAQAADRRALLAQFNALSGKERSAFYAQHQKTLLGE